MDRYAVISVDPLTGISTTAGIYEGATHTGEGDVASEQAHRRAEILERRGYKVFVVGLK